MDLVERNLSSLSGLAHHIYGVQDGERETHIQVVSFAGEYRIGSGGEGDAAYMRGIVLAAVSAWDVGCLVLDLRELDYSWGYALLGVVEAPGELKDDDFPVLLVVSARCRDGVASLLQSAPESFGDVLFDSLEDALASARQAVRVYLGE
jgi:hypothetical protein